MLVVELSLLYEYFKVIDEIEDYESSEESDDAKSQCDWDEHFEDQIESKSSYFLL